MHAQPASLVVLCFVTLACGFSCSDDDDEGAPSSPPSEAGAAGAAGEGGRAGAGADSGGASAAGGAEPSEGGSGGEPVDPCTLPWTRPLEPGDCDLDDLAEGETLTGYIDADVVLQSGRIHYLDGRVRVQPGVTLTIEKCSKVVGKPGGSSLVIQPGARIEAAGEAAAPIVFTSPKEAGERAAGDWEGLLVLGRARTNASVSGALPGLASSYGSDTSEHDDESSGTLTYVRVEFAGRSIDDVAGTARAGLTFAGVGRGTVAHHLQVLHSVGDCFEWRGGTVDHHHLVAIGCRDDLFDAEEGYSGSVQFAFGRQWPVQGGPGIGVVGSVQDMMKVPPPNHQHVLPGSHGLELNTADPLPPGTESPLPLTSARWSNLTLCGQRSYELLLPNETSSQDPPNPRVGLALRGNTAGTVQNALVTGFHEGLRYTIAQDAADDEPPAVRHVELGDNRLPVGEGFDWFDEQDGNQVTGFDGLCDCWSSRPSPFPRDVIEGGAADGHVDEAANFVGAFADARPESNWLAEPWVGFADD